MALKVAVIDIGKTNAKLLLVDLATGAEVAVFKTANRVLPGPPYPHFDVEGLWAFLLSGLAELARAHEVAAISITTHGAAAVLVVRRLSEGRGQNSDKHEKEPPLNDVL